MANAVVRLDLIQAELSLRRWSKMELYERMLACGWDGAWRSVYNVLDGTVADPKLETIDAMAVALGVPITKLYEPTHVAKASRRDRKA